MRNKFTWGVLMLLAVTVLVLLCVPGPVFADKLADAIAAAPQGTGPGQIDPSAAKGVYGIPGAPSPGLLLCFLWAIWVGWIFSTVGAFGGIMAGVGHITIYGLGAYAKTFKDTTPALNKLVTDSIRVSNQWLVGLSALVSTINYGKQKRLVTSLGFFLGIGALFATLIVVFSTAGKISFSQYQGWFGLCVFLIFAFMVYEMSPKGQASKKAAKDAAKAFENTVKTKGDIAGQGVKTLKWSVVKTQISFFGQTFSFSPIWAFVGGFLISALASFIGVGGGFLYVPFLTSVVGLPMFVVAGTSAVAVLIGMVFSIFNFMVLKGIMVYWPMIGVELIGVFVGSMIGPRTGKYIPEKVLKWIFLVLALYIGLRYTMRGFFGIAML
ncbi:MAG: sulfite exporter TauE/SafE family protein [Proteobacteria bacterium]|nr:sulfite exporter TauE/SafE family protein [Pseudomonadota bacterium]MBU1387304.1 sulfite exporter TauE/SafE family protein [Pseudomonadota bacterium]MBU1544286.1 sulfite exporter TauE/SafE family protein [Pseudomonadota bacterium]MBU2430315.1 sulfite exporter TauE/SafE family protein [Pseudomonadota bacterium]